MNAKELRLGNWFQDEYTGDKFQVVYISDGVIGFDYETSAKWQAEPIPITEEILLECGFIEGFRGKHSLRIDYDKDVRFHWRTVHGVSFICYRGVELHDVRFLHQLQNLYFSITNKELEVKL